MSRSFHDEFVEVFNGHFQRVRRYLHRLSGEPQLAADLAQDTFIKLYQRGSLPQTPEAWLITVATNLFRNERSKHRRRARLLTMEMGQGPGASVSSADARDSCRHVRRVLDGLPERERSLLLLRAEGYSYRDISIALGIHEASVGTLLARAKRAFLELHGGDPDAS